MRNVPLSQVDAIPRAVLAIATDYPPDTLLPRHVHRRAQFLYGMSGLMEVLTDDGAWVIPPGSGVWIPPGKPHQVRMRGVSTRSLYIEPTVLPRPSSVCEALRVGPLLHQLLLASAEVPALHDEAGRDGLLLRLVLHELGQAEPLPLFAPLPAEPRLAALCQAFLAQPSVHTRGETWAAQLNWSPRTFSRRFREQTGLSFGRWRQQACLMAAVTRLATGEAVTTIALDLGYESPSAFSSLYRRVMGQPPSTARQGL
ncbi:MULTISPECIES: AraC family transcriptional regulator [Pseudomonas]|uniref:Helix-turn-helix transcriptional regulator n=1 Tax=Pseudomonas mosselii TaxID=78327 RepID=A0A7W2Q1H1_9PSED|nr:MULTISPECIES: helix-turn-helix transcriptional regulator [Pseudomonas]KXG80478.1 AraC family transcriptional regulator [Pseudomonas mosselii]MBA6068540.1 helix-turn-helix transcriptional regulator [Pseudomonas mosselii]MBC3459404.1 helix-turn-helix transcriptional regulator [Pseudomonas mosselii]MBH3310628.1 helix-turn-helix transcriptional regulator [Pseudomonas mosselii]MBH3325738.1 helix-turn-helix transcriptional regulator [Pseudomonas mosselii]